MKFSTSTGIGEVIGDQKIVRQCFISTMRTESSSKWSAQKQLRIDGAEIEALKDEMAIKAQTLADFIAKCTHDVALELEMILPEVETPKK